MTGQILSRHFRMKFALNLQPVHKSAMFIIRRKIASKVKTQWSYDGFVQYQSINQPIKQWFNQPINQPIYQPINQSINQSTNQPINQSINQSTNQPINQSINQSIDQLINQSINEVVRRALAVGGVEAILEPPGLVMENDRRPDGMTLVPWTRGISLVWDVTCIDTLAASHLTLSTVRAGAAAEEAEEKKSAKYGVLEGRFLFEPLGFETCGPWGPNAKKLIRDIGQLIVQKTGEKRSLEFLKQRISLEIQRGNAISVLSTLPESRKFDEVFYFLCSKK